MAARQILVLKINNKKNNNTCNGILSGSAWVSWYQNGKANLHLLVQETVNDLS